jgi:hypothetical protein
LSQRPQSTIGVHGERLWGLGNSGFACRANTADAFVPMQSSVPSCRSLRPLCQNPFSGWGFDHEWTRIGTNRTKLIRPDLFTGNGGNRAGFPADRADQRGLDASLSATICEIRGKLDRLAPFSLRAPVKLFDAGARSATGPTTDGCFARLSMTEERIGAGRRPGLQPGGMRQPKTAR